MKSFNLLFITFSAFLFLSASSYNEKASNVVQPCVETVIVIYEHENSCGGFSGFYYIKNGDGICGNNYFQTLKTPCKKPVPAPGHPF